MIDNGETMIHDAWSSWWWWTRIDDTWSWQRMLEWLITTIAGQEKETIDNTFRWTWQWPPSTNGGFSSVLPEGSQDNRQQSPGGGPNGNFGGTAAFGPRSSTAMTCGSGRPASINVSSAKVRWKLKTFARTIIFSPIIYKWWIVNTMLDYQGGEIICNSQGNSMQCVESTSNDALAGQTNGFMMVEHDYCWNCTVLE